MISNLTTAYGLWIGTLAAQCGVFVLMLRNQLFREMPIFFSYTIFHILRSLALLGIRSWYTPTQYSYAYWGAEAISAVLGFAVIYEVFSDVLKQYEGIRRLGLMLFRWTFLVLILVAIVSAGNPDTNNPHTFISSIIVLERSIRIIQCGLMGFLFLFGSTLALSWRHYAFGIALGFGLFASVELILAAVRAQLGPVADHVYVLLKPGSYAFATLIWSAYLISPFPKPMVVATIPNNQIEQWNEAILGLLAR